MAELEIGSPYLPARQHACQLYLHDFDNLEPENEWPETL